MPPGQVEFGGFGKYYPEHALSPSNPNMGGESPLGQAIGKLEILPHA